MNPNAFVASVMEQLSEFLHPGQRVLFTLHIGCSFTQQGQEALEPVVGTGESTVEFTVFVGEAKPHTLEI